MIPFLNGISFQIQSGDQFRILIETDGLIKGKNDATIKELIATFHYDLIFVKETKGKLNNYKNVSAEVLLLSGKKPFLFLKHSLNALKTVLPHIKRVINQ